MINLKVLERLIKAEKTKKGFMSWTEHEGRHYLTNRRWLVGLPEITPNIQASLLTVGVLEVNTNKTGGQAPNVSGLIAGTKNSDYKPTNDTGFIYETSDKKLQMRLLKGEKGLSAINTKYFDLYDGGQLYSSGVFDPVFTLDPNGEVEIILLPIRVQDNIIEKLKGLVS